MYLLCSFGQNNSDLHTLIGHALILLWSLKERHIQNISITRLELPQASLEIAIPTNTEFVVPLSEDWISGSEFQIGFGQVTSEATSRDVSDIVCEVRVGRADLERHLNPLKCRAGRFVVVLTLPLDTGELRLELCCIICEPVALFRCKIATPVADFYVALK
jgi:hypothetical protein